MNLRVGRSREADRYAPGGRNYSGPIFGQRQSMFGRYSPYQRPQRVMSIPTGGFAGRNQIGGQSSINVFRIPPPPLTPEQQREKDLEDRAKRLRQGEAEFELNRREAELEQRRIDAEQIARGKHRIDGRPVSAREMFEATGDYYQQDYVTPPKVTPQQERQNAVQQSLRQFLQDPMQFIFGGGQNVGELLSYLNQLNQLFRFTGQEGNFMDFLLGSPLARQDRPSSPSPSSFRTPGTSGAIPIGAKSVSRSPRKRNNSESASARLARLGIRPEEQSQILGALGSRGRGTFVAREFDPRAMRAQVEELPEALARIEYIRAEPKRLP